jgi:hypothetical protein
VLLYTTSDHLVAEHPQPARCLAGLRQPVDAIGAQSAARDTRRPIAIREGHPLSRTSSACRSGPVMSRRLRP